MWDHVVRYKIEINSKWCNGVFCNKVFKMNRLIANCCCCCCCVLQATVIRTKWNKSQKYEQAQKPEAAKKKETNNST